MERKIPFILHQTWKSKNLPENFLHWQNSFLLNNPGIDLKFYDDSDNRELLMQTFPNLLDLYDSFEREIFRVDFVRAVYLFKFGGIYADLDFQCLRSLDNILSNHSGVVLGQMGTRSDFVHSVPNALMASSPNQAFWIAYLRNIQYAWENCSEQKCIRPEYITGPVVLKQTVIEFQADSTEMRKKVEQFLERNKIEIEFSKLKWDSLDILPSNTWYPLDWSDNIHRMYRKKVLDQKILLSVDEARQLFPHSTAVTYWTQSWSPATSLTTRLRKLFTRETFRRMRRALKRLI